MQLKNFAVAVLLAIGGLVGQSKAQAESFQVAPPITVLSTQQMQKFGIDYPDLNLGALRKGGGGKYFIFSSGGSFGGIGPGITVVPPGTYRFLGSLNNFAPSQYKGPYPAASLLLGRLQPSPDGSDFDRDYAGGGATYEENVDGKPSLVQIYHGEFWKNYPNGSQFYSAEGVAVSFNGGSFFTKLGEFLTPHVTREQFFASLQPGQTAGVSSDGFLVEADVNGNAIAANAGEIYLYEVFEDLESVGSRPGFAVGRIKKADFLEALSMQKVPLIKKYYQPGGGFTEPGLGGSSTLVVTQGTDFIAKPQVRYSPYLRKFVLIYQTNQNKVQVRTSTNLLNWSQSTPITLIDSSSNPNLKTFYPAAVGLDADPALLGQKFLLYFQQRGAAFPPNPNLFSSEVTIR